MKLLPQWTSLDSEVGNMSELEFKHISVMLNECIEQLNIKPDGIYIDGTAGGAGHSS